MERLRPKMENDRVIPVNIYKGEQLAVKCSSIQEAARWLKEDTQQERFNWSAINNGIWHDKPYSYNGVTYFFLTAAEAVEKKLKEIKAKQESPKIKGTIEIDPNRNTISIRLENGHYCFDHFPNGIKTFLEDEIETLIKQEKINR
jgi:hypothetical protein